MSSELSETPSIAELRREIDYLERAPLSMGRADTPSARAAAERALAQLRRRRKQLRAAEADDFDNWPRYSPAPVESAG